MQETAMARLTAFFSYFLCIHSAIAHTWQVHSVQPSTVHSSFSLYTMPLWRQMPVWFSHIVRISFLSIVCGKERRERRELLKLEDGKLPLCQSSNTNESVTDTVIKTFLDSSEAVQMQTTAKHICVFTWVSLRCWPAAAIAVTSGCTVEIH